MAGQCALAADFTFNGDEVLPIRVFDMYYEPRGPPTYGSYQVVVPSFLKNARYSIDTNGTAQVANITAYHITSTPGPGGVFFGSLMMELNATENGTMTIELATDIINPHFGEGSETDILMGITGNSGKRYDEFNDRPLPYRLLFSNATENIIAFDFTPADKKITIIARGYDEMVSSFNLVGTRSGLVITEVELDSVNGSQWIEVYNPTDHQISTGAMLINGSNGAPSLQFDGSSYSYSYVKPNQYQVITLDKSPPWLDVNQTIAIYDTWTGQAVFWDKTPALTDTFNDTKTWQLADSSTGKWAFAKETPMREVPEFGPLAILAAASMAGIVALAKYRCPLDQ